MPTRDANRLRIGEAARKIGVSVDTLRRWERAGKLSAIRTDGGERRFDEAEIDAFIAERLPRPERVA